MSPFTRFPFWGTYAGPTAIRVSRLFIVSEAKWKPLQPPGPHRITGLGVEAAVGAKAFTARLTDLGCVGRRATNNFASS